MKALLATPLLTLVLAVAGCGGSNAPVTPGQARDRSGEITVEGSLLALSGQPVRLCPVLLESDPPQCGPPSIVVRGLDLDALRGLASTRPGENVTAARWSNRPVRLTGTVEDGVLTVGPG